MTLGLFDDSQGCFVSSNGCIVSSEAVTSLVLFCNLLKIMISHDDKENVCRILEAKCILEK